MDSAKPAVAREQTHLGEKLFAILKICQKINSERDLTALLDLIAVEATELLEADRATIFLLDREKHELWSKVALGSEEILRFDAGAGIAGAVVKTGKLINVEDAHRDTRFYPGIDARTGYHTRSLLAVPLLNFEGQIIGAFETLNKTGGAFTGEDEEILKALAAQAAVAIETAQVVGEMARRREQLMQENTQLWREVEGKFSAQNILGNSAKIQSVLKMIKQISDTSVSVLITGESGTGKELVAKAIHYNSPRARRLFVAMNCAALPEHLVESELFGIEKGVATGVDRRIGKFEMAHNGTLFLDEIGDLSLAAQSKILRVLQERVIERVGGRKAIAVDIRILAATNKDLAEGIKKGTFREDLYYRLKVIHIRMPPLREIREDVPILANYSLANNCREMNRKPMHLASQALSALMNYPWPGNVRELENEIKRLVVTVRKNTITEEDLSEAMRSASDAAPPSNSQQEPSLKKNACKWSLQGLIKKIRS